MDMKKVEDFILSKYENKKTQSNVKSYVKKGISILEGSGISEPTENDFSIIPDKHSQKYTREFYFWLNGQEDIERKSEEISEGEKRKEKPIKKSNINFLIDTERHKILSALALQLDTTITAILTAAIDDYFLSHVEQIEKVKKFLFNE